nr:ParB/RepB/Spo0J family partition protein [uncultured Aminipila sp.]
MDNHKQIVYIPVDKIYPHPDNPRKDLGDLEELAESIKAKGILQNLTLVPRDDETYFSIIGHRRHAAAKLAGLAEVPCVISEMDHKEQVATMLLENMQRSDLTVYEQAQGFQMMIDLGESVSGISGKTGFSESTVRRRVKLLELDQDKFKESVGRGATLMDYAELEKIESTELRNSVLEKIGTQNFKWELQRAIDKEKTQKNMARIIKSLEEFATRTDNSSGMRYVKNYYASQKDEVIVPEDAETIEYYFTVSEYGTITLYSESTQTETNPNQSTAFSKEQEERNRLKKALGDVSDQAYKLRYDFVLSISNTEAKKHTGVIIEYTIKAMIEDTWGLDAEDFANLFDIKGDEEKDWEFDNFKEQISKQPERSLLASIYGSLDSNSQKYYDWYGNYEENKELDSIYELLEKFGYEMSDEERQLKDGTHELFGKTEGSL